MGATSVKLGPLMRTFEAIALPDIAPAPERGENWVRFSQTAGGRTGVPAPRRVRRRPFVQWQAPLVWTTLSLTIHADGRAKGELTGASRFPRHWVYDGSERLSHKSGLADFKDWYRKSFGRHTPWGDTDSEALVTAVETALERALSTQIMQGERQAGDPQAQGRERARAGRAKPDRRCSCCSTACCGSRRTGSARRVRAGCAARRARAPGARRAHLDAGGGHAVPRRGGRSRPARPLCAAGARQGPPTHEAGPELSQLEGPLLRRAGLDPGARHRVRALRRAHLVRGAEADGAAPPA